MLKIKKYKEKEHYPILLEWFKSYNWIPYPKTMISPYSYIGYYKDEPVVYLGVYIPKGCKIAQMGFIISSKNSDKKIKSKLIKKLFEKIDNLLKKKGITFVSYYTASQYLKSLYEEHGFVCTDNGNAYILSKTFNSENLFLNEEVQRRE